MDRLLQGSTLIIRTCYDTYLCFFLYKTVITLFLFLILQANPGVSTFKHVGLPDLDLYKNVFDKASVTGGLGYSSSQMPPDIDEEQDIEDHFLYPDDRPFEQDADEEAFQDYIGGNVLETSVQDCLLVEEGDGRKGLLMRKELVLL